MGMQQFAEFSLAIPKQDARFRPGMSTLLDTRLATPPGKPNAAEETEFQLFGEEIQSTEMASMKRKLAIVVGDLTSFGVTRMRAARLDDSTLALGVYNSIPEALAWLGLSAEVEADLVVDDSLVLQVSFQSP